MRPDRSAPVRGQAVPVPYGHFPSGLHLHGGGGVTYGIIKPHSEGIRALRYGSGWATRHPGARRGRALSGLAQKNIQMRPVQGDRRPAAY